MKTCKVENCERPHCAKGYCQRHYYRVKKHGHPQSEIPIGAFNHGHSKNQTPEYLIWEGMRARCSNPNHKSHKYYGAKGIRVCKRWEFFPNFLKDMGERPTDSHTIGRKDPNKNYSKSNCRWETRTQQARALPTCKLSKFKVRAIRDFSKVMNRPSLAKKFGVSLSTIDSVLSGKTWGDIS